MDTLKLAVPLTTREPLVAGDPRLKPGVYRVELVVQGARSTSTPAVLTLRVTDSAR